MTELQAFLDSEAGLALKALLLVSFLDFATGVFAAARDGTFRFDAIGAFIRKHIAGRVAPIALLLLAGYFGGASGTPFLAGAIAAGAAYVTETIASVWGNIAPPAPTDEVPDVNPVPTA